MTRDELTTYLGARFTQYLLVTIREAVDTPAGVGGIIDDTLRTLGVAYADLATATSVTDDETDDWTIQAAYRAMVQITRDLGATMFDLNTGGDAYRLSQLRVAAEAELAETKAAVLDRFKTLGVVATDTGSLIGTFDLNTMVPDEVCG